MGRRLSVGINLDITTEYGRISIENSGPFTIKIYVPNTKTLRYLMGNYSNFDAFIDNQFGKKVSNDLRFDILKDRESVAIFDGGQLTGGRWVFLFFQYLLSKIGF